MAFSSPPTELWRIGILRKPLAEFAFLAPEERVASGITWIEHTRDFAFLADPFGIERGGWLYLFAEAYNYREKHGHIVAYRVAQDGRAEALGTVLREPWHLSYPFVFEHENEAYMLPEAHRSGRLTLYRAVDFPTRWAPVQTVLELPAIDPTLWQHEGRFWVAFSLPDAPLTAMHLAYAYRLEGPWHLHPENPVLEGIDCARPGGTPFLKDGALHLPVQDASKGYGSALNLLKITQLDTQGFAANQIGRIAPGAWSFPYDLGIHTISGTGTISLFDTKNVITSPKRHIVNLERRIKRLF
jgi:hypothetical protein